MSARYRLEATWDLVRRYAGAFGYFWAKRRTLMPDFFNQQEAEFLPAALSLQERPESSSLRWTARILMVLVVATLAWSIFGRLDIVVNASGKVIPSMRTKTIASVDVASVRALRVTEGQRVHTGDVLIELDSSGSDSEHDKALGAVAQARLQVARSQSMMAAVQQGLPPFLSRVPGVTDPQWQQAWQQVQGQYRDFTARLTRLDGEIARYSKELPLAAARADDYRLLLADNDVSRHGWSEKEQARVDLEGQLADARNQRNTLIAQTLREAHDAMLEGNKIVAAGAQDMRRAGEHSKLLKLTAPVDGVVQQLVVHTVGGVVPAAQPLMQIVPTQTHIEVEAFLENRDVGFVHEGQTAAVKVDAFDYTKYGTIAAVVSNVSMDAIQDEKKGLIYSTRVLLDKNSIFVDGRMLPLSAGMAVNVEIRTGTRRVIEYVLSPLMQHQREVMRER